MVYLIKMHNKEVEAVAEEQEVVAVDKDIAHVVVVVDNYILFSLSLFHLDINSIQK